MFLLLGTPYFLNLFIYFFLHSLLVLDLIDPFSLILTIPLTSRIGVFDKLFAYWPIRHMRPSPLSCAGALHVEHLGGDALYPHAVDRGPGRHW